MNNNTQESKIQLEYINKCTELVKEKYKKAPALLYPECRLPDEFPADGYSGGIVKRMGLYRSIREEDADVVIYNTCTVRGECKPEDLQSSWPSEKY